MKCFIGLPAAPSVINKLVDAQDRALSFDAGARPVPKENFHLTLAFIGEIEPDKARLIAQLLPLTTDFNGKSWLIDNSGLFIRPQVAWVGGCLSGDRTFGPRIARDFGSSPYLLRQRPF
ncbi:MAG: 2'-5' RNA ligase family protein [Parasutterella excrementihominis]